MPEAPDPHSLQWQHCSGNLSSSAFAGITASVGDTRAFVVLLPTVALMSHFHVKRDTGWDYVFYVKNHRA